MSEDKSTSKVGGWIKAGVTSVCGLLSGAVLMYLSPLVGSAIKPPKPVANFSQEVNGWTVTFQNRSTGGKEGWWDFGDGSALEPFNPQQESVTHNYARPGMYTAKLSLRNFLGEENDRAVAVNLDGTSAGSSPVIEAFQVLPQGPEIAPATYQIVSKVKNADMVIIDAGDGRPFDINNDAGNHDRLISIAQPGEYKIRLVAVSGKQTVESARDLHVSVGDFSAPRATLQVSYDAVHVHRVQQAINVAVTFPAECKDHTCTFKEERRAEAGFRFVDARLAQPVKDASVQKVDVKISPDGTKFIVSGTLVKPAGLMNRNAPPPQWAATVNATLERRSTPQQKVPDPIMVNLNMPGSVTLPLPTLSGHWEAQGRQLNLEIREGSKVALRCSKLPAVQNVMLRNRLCRISIIEQAGGIRIDVADAGKGLGIPGR